MAEAMDFREWCENECARLIGSKGMIFLVAHLWFLFYSHGMSGKWLARNLPANRQVYFLPFQVEVKIFLIIRGLS